MGPMWRGRSNGWVNSYPATHAIFAAGMKSCQAESAFDTSEWDFGRVNVEMVDRTGRRRTRKANCVV